MAEPTLSGQEALERALEQHHTERWPEVETVCRRILESDPNQPATLNFLGVLAIRMGKHALAVDLIGQTITIHQ